MTQGLTIVVSDSEVSAMLSKLQGKMQNMRPVFDAIGAKVESNTQLRFDVKRAPDGTAWQALKQSTLDRYAKKYKGSIPGSLLERSVKMRGSLNYQASDDRVIIGFGQPYALFHEFGTKHMPRRGLLLGNPTTGKLGEKDFQSVLKLMRKFFDI